MKLPVNKLKDFAKWRLISDQARPGKELFKILLPLILNDFYIKTDWVLFGRIISLQIAGLSLAINIRK
jgi:hypothetical protein